LYAFTLRELVWRAEALQMDAWDRAAWVSLHCVMPHAGRKRVRFEDVHPLRHKPEPQPVTKAWREEMIAKGVLRRERTPEEKERAWREFCRRVDVES
jgi:hypothetical protein